MSLCLLLTPSMWLPCGSLELHGDESAGLVERRECVAFGEQGWRGVEEAVFEWSAGPGQEGRYPLRSLPTGVF